MIGKQIHRGQALALIMVAIFGILALTALAIDGGNAFGDRRKAQSAADNAAVAAALALTDKNSLTVYTNEALLITQANSRPDETVTVSYPPGIGCDGAAFSYAGLYDTDPAHYVGVVIHSLVPTFFGPVIGIDTLSHCVEAVARAKPEELTPGFPGAAIVALNCIEDRAFNAYGNGTLTVGNGSIYVNSSSTGGSKEALYSGGSSIVQAPGYTVVGSAAGNLLNEDGSGPGVIKYQDIAYPCPDTRLLKNISCGTEKSKVVGTYTYPDDGSGSDLIGTTWDIISPGELKGTDVKKGAYFQPGIYCVKGDIKLVSDYLLKGDGILLYFTNGNIDLGGDGTIQFTPYFDETNLQNPLNNLLLYSDFSNTSTFKWNGNSQSYFEGTILTLGSTFVINGTGDEEGHYSQIIADIVEWGGTGDGMINYNEGENADFLLPAEIELVH